MLKNEENENRRRKRWAGENEKGEKGGKQKLRPTDLTRGKQTSSTNLPSSNP